MVEQSGEPLLLSFLCCLPHTVQPLGHALPALCRVHVRLNDVLPRLRPSLPSLRGSCPPLFGGFSDYAGPKQPLPICAAAVLPSSYSEWSRPPDLRAFRSSIAPPTGASVYASRNTSRCPRQDSRSGWIRYFPSCRALASPTTCRFTPAHSGLPVMRSESPRSPT